MTWPLGDTNFIFAWEILSALDDKIRIPARPCNMGEALCYGPIQLVWFHSVFNSSQVEVFSCPFAFSHHALPLFYQSLLLAGSAVDGSFSWSCSALVMASTDPHQFALASSMTAKSAYLYILSVNFVPLHGEEVTPSVQLVVLAYHLEAAWLLSLGQADYQLGLAGSAWCSLHYYPNCFFGTPETPSHLFF